MGFYLAKHIEYNMWLRHAFPLAQYVELRSSNGKINGSSPTVGKSIFLQLSLALRSLQLYKTYTNKIKHNIHQTYTLF